MSIRVLLADDHPIVRSGIRNELAHYPDIEVVGEAIDGNEALSLTDTLHPDVLLLDLNMPGPKAVHIIRTLQTRSNPPRVLVLTAYSDIGTILGMLKAGVHGYLLKDEELGMISEGIRAVVQGKIWLSNVITQSLIGHTVQEESNPPQEMLSPRELEVLRLLAQGCSNQRIAAELSISKRTVRFHVENILSKLRVSNRTEAVTVALQRKWIDL
ncbi:Transcriptional regulatory protein LiaR [Thermoflexales bacterium]|nr:Transcriptional regulatory protein LiaR [Thermoflexales bacterium]